MDASRHAAADHAALEAAADWYARLCTSDTEAQRAEWSRWLDARPEHRHAWTLIEAVSQRFAPL
ncbi:DUF4880 domain-containing protein, partial [Burkholderia sp. Ac-20379]|uniref:DUF4880 domain-containing protein n=1 Tax=Burkholderia sp. Ac-20379 TaxID=2703900 RepID=UPI00197FA455